MDGESPSQDLHGSTETTDQTDNNNNDNQEKEPEPEENKNPEKETSAVEGHGVTGEENEKHGEQGAGVGDTDIPESTEKHVESEETGQNKGEASVSDDVNNPEPIEKEGEVETDVVQKGRQVEEAKSCEDEKDKDEMMEKNKEKDDEKTEEKAKEEDVKATKEEEKKPAEKSAEESKDKGNITEVRKQGKTKRKSGAAPPSALTRPRTSARSVRASAKKDIIAKFQQGAPETPMPRNFKIQKSATAMATGASIKQKILHWCCNKTRKYEGINIENFSSSWCDGMAFCALIHRFFPDAFDYSSLKPEEREKNFTLAFQTAESLADCFPLLDVADMLMMGNNPDPMCVFTYVQSLCQNLTKIEKERKEKDKDKEVKDKADKDKGGKEEDAAEEDEGAPPEMKEDAEGEGTGEEDNALQACATEGDAGLLLGAES